jgi:hypothetical protein
VGRIVAERDEKVSIETETLKRIVDLINSKQDLKISYSEDDPEHPDNLNMKYAQGPGGELAKLNTMLDFLANNTKNDDLWNLLHQLADGMIHNMSPDRVALVIKIKDYLIKQANVTKESIPVVGLDEDVITELRRKIS